MRAALAICCMQVQMLAPTPKDYCCVETIPKLKMLKAAPCDWCFNALGEVELTFICFLVANVFFLLLSTRRSFSSSSSKIFKFNVWPTSVSQVTDGPGACKQILARLVPVESSHNH